MGNLNRRRGIAEKREHLEVDESASDEAVADDGDDYGDEVAEEGGGEEGETRDEAGRTARGRTARGSGAAPWGRGQTSDEVGVEAELAVTTPPLPLMGPSGPRTWEFTSRPYVGQYTTPPLPHLSGPSGPRTWECTSRPYVGQ